ncbi:MAG: glutamate-5-semialdehyde dehydrogenase [Clostridia bacterium]|nr:glutamate-5-semialdehyde dehydrogenase [Clostridia bacterium]
MNLIEKMGASAKIASKSLAVASSAKKDEILRAISAQLREDSDAIIRANAADVSNARANGIAESMIDRLLLDEKRIGAIADACINVSNLPDPVGEVISGGERPNGIKITKVRVPIGVIGIIYESRPNVTVDAAILCLKSGNAVILRGGKEAIESNKALACSMRKAVEKTGFDKNVIQLVEDTSRDIATQMMKANGFIDVLIPRGGAGLIRSVIQNATVPVIETGTGNCHIFVDESADVEMAVRIVDNAKTQRPSVCNAAESCLVHEKIAKEFLPKLAKLFEEKKVEIRGCDKTREIISAKAATDEDYATEFLDYIISVKVVGGVDEAIDHISKYSTGHSESIVTSSYENAEKFKKSVDSAAVYVNCSTRFTDGEEFGLGAEIGISTQKLHARGPMGLRELTSQKYTIDGTGQIR